jgi:cobalt-zinc-cadmium efflux system membrane fusion protein
MSMFNSRPFTHARRRITSGALCAVSVLALAGCGRPPSAMEGEVPDSPEGAVAVSPEGAAAAGITTAVVTTIERADAVEASGVVALDERRTARLGAFVEGVVADIRVQPGDRVASGAVIAAIHSHVVHDAWAGYFKARADAQRAEAEVEYANTAESRAAGLVADRALSQQELQRARADATASRQVLAAARAEVLRAEQELRHYGIVPSPDVSPRDHDHVPITAPFAGTVVEVLTAEGAAVTPGSALFVIADLSRVWITAEVDEQLAGRLGEKRPAMIRTAAYPGETFAGTLAHIGDMVNPSTRRVPLRIEADSGGRRLKPQMFATVTLDTEAPRKMTVVPAESLQVMDGETVVFVRTGAGTFERRLVAVGADVGGQVEVLRGVAEGDVVATSGAFLLKSALSAPSVVED